ncbi:MAG: ArgR family transcriptional regulator [Paludibacteraceae bacterium]|nr:ArgR family transcriptional regulator [Paludibacteraceae bacterium]
MNARVNRMRTISQILSAQVISNQEQLTRALRLQGVEVTQATLSRDLRDLRAEKKVMNDGTQKYVIPPDPIVEQKVLGIDTNLAKMSIRSIEFSGPFAVVKTRPGFANAVAYDIDTRGQELTLGTIAGDDTILVIPREGISREEVERFLNAD